MSMNLALKIVVSAEHQEHIIPLGGKGYRVELVKGAHCNMRELSNTIRSYFETFDGKDEITVSDNEARAALHASITEQLDGMYTPSILHKYIERSLSAHTAHITKVMESNKEYSESLFDPAHSGIYGYLFSDEECITIPLVDDFKHYVVNEKGSTFAKL